MKTLTFFAILVCTSLARHNGYNLNLKNDGPTVIGGKINFIAELYENGQPASGYFRYDWEDNTYVPNTESHQSNSPIDVWTVIYSKNKVPLPGKYVATVTVRKLSEALYIPVARLQIKFEIKGESDDRQPHTVISKSWADYKRDKILSSQNYALNNILDPTVKSIVSQRIDKINARIPLLQLSDQTPKVDKKREESLEDIIKYKRENILNSQNNELNYISNPQVSSVVSERIKAINSKIPIMQDWFTIPLEKHNKKIEDLKESEKLVLDTIQEPIVKEAVMSRIKEENARVPFLSKSDNVNAKFSDALDVIHKRIKEIQKSQKVTLKNIKDAEVRDQVLKRINEENKWLESKSKDIDAKLTDSLKTIHERMTELKQIEAETLAGIDDPVLKQKLRYKLEKQSNKVATLLTSTVEPTPLDDINNKIKELEIAETEAVARVDDPTIKGIVLNKLNEQNKQIPTLLKSDDVDDKFASTIDAIHSRINDEIEKSNSVILDGIKNPTVKAMVHDRIAAENEKRAEESKQIDSNLTLSLTEIQKKLAAIKKSEKQIAENSTGPTKEEILDAIEEHNKQIPTLLLPSVIDTNFSVALDAFNDKIANLSNFLDAAAVNITNPFILSTIQAKMALVNFKLISKYNQLKENFTALLDQMAAESNNGPTDAIPVQQIPTAPRLTKMFGPGIPIPQIQTLVEQKMAYKQIPFNILFGSKTSPPAQESAQSPPRLSSIFGPGMVLPQIQDMVEQKMAIKQNMLFGDGTDPAMSNPILDKIAAKNQIIQAKSNLIGSGLSSIMSTIRARIEALKVLEDEAVANITDPAIKDEVQNTIDEENKKVPLLLLPYGIETNFTKALDAFHAKIDNLKNSVDVITANISFPAIKAAVSSKFDFVNQILMNKYAQLDSNFTTILEKIQARFANLSNQADTETMDNDEVPRPVPVLSKTMDASPTFDLSKISTLIKSKMTGKQKLTNSSLIGVKDPAVKTVILDKITERSKNMSLIADKIAANFSKIMDAIVNKTDELQELETLTLDSIDDPALQAAVLSEIEEENKKIPSLSLSKRSDKKKPEEEEIVTPKPNIFKMRYPLIIRF